MKMLAKTGLLIVSNPTQIGKILPSVKKQIEKTLYIQLVTALNDTCVNNIGKINPCLKINQIIHGIYSQAVAHCYDLDVRVLLSGIKNKHLKQIHTNNNVDLVIFDKQYNQKEIDNFIKSKIVNIAKMYQTVTLDIGTSAQDLGQKKTEENLVFYQHVVLGGTFDRLHVAHKLLLTEAALLSQKIVTVGVTEETMITNKVLWELIEDISVRIQKVKDFLTDICPELTYNIVPISDPFGPTITDPSMDLIVVSTETIKGADKINEIRKSKNFKALQVKVVDLVDEPNPSPHEEGKISSSNLRLRALGTLIKPITNKDIPFKSYVVGLTGGIASGKSYVGKILEHFGALVIYCDDIGHGIYKKGKPCYQTLIKHFGSQIIGTDGEIDRKVLGGIVFNDHNQMEKLNSFVWPAIEDEVRSIISRSNQEVVVVEAAILTSAGWNKMCHEIWTTVTPKETAVERLIKTRNLTRDQALSRISSQPSTIDYVQESNVVFYTHFPDPFTKVQVEKAWKLLKERIPKADK